MAAEGKNEVARSLLDLQPTAILELYKLYPDTVNAPSVYLSFHGGSVFAGNVVWQSIQYIPIPVEAEGFGVFGDGTLPRPKLKVSNSNKIVTYFLGKYKDFKNAKIYRKKVFVKHLDDANFDGNNPFGLANSDSEISEEKYLIGQKIQENKAYVEFELNLPLDLDNFDINHRTVNAKYCYWQYRGLGCRYAGLPVEKDDGSQFQDADGNRIAINVGEDFDNDLLFYEPNKTYSKGDIVYLENKNIILTNPENGKPGFHRTFYVCVSGNSNQNPEDNPTYWQKDGCTKKIEGCQKRFSSKSLQKISIGQEEATFNYLHLDGASAAMLMTSGQEIKDVFDDDDWTLSLWMRGEAQHQTEEGNWRSPSVMSTHSLPRQVVGGKNTYISLGDTFGTDVKANLFYSTRDSKRPGSYLEFATIQEDGGGSKLTEINASIPSKEKFHFVIFRKNAQSEIEVLVDPYRDQYGNVTAASTNVIQSSTNSLGVDFFSLFSDRNTDLYAEICFGGDLAQACLWNKKLTDDEVIWMASENSVSTSETYLLDNSLKKPVYYYNSYAPLRYAQATGQLSSLTGEGDNGLIFWYDMVTGEVSSQFVVEDESSHNYYITGYGATEDFETRTIEYTKGSFETYIPNQNSTFELPFGGFPGTDGFDFRSEGSQRI